MAEKVQDWKDWNGIKWEEGDFILAERMNLLQDNVQSLKDTIDIHNLLVENSDGTWNIAETRDVIMNVLTVAPSYDDLQFPVNEGDYCWHEGSLYCANTDIATAEAWTAAHWDIKPIGDDVIAAYERIDEIQKSAEIQTLGSLENRVGVLENNTVNKWGSFPANTVILEGTYCIYENKIYYAINDFTKTSSETDEDSNPSSSHFCIEVANTTVRPKKIQIDDSAIEINRGISSSGQLTVTSFNEKTKKGGYGKVIHIDKTELYNHGKKIYITTTNHAGRFFAAALLNVNPATEGYSYTPTDSEETIVVNVITNSADNVIVADCNNRELTSIKYRILDINNLDNEAQEKLAPAELTNNIYLLLYYGNSTTNPNELPREEILKDISIYYGVGTTQEQLDDLSARIDTTALEDSIGEIRNQIGTTETDKTLWEAIETNQNAINANSLNITAHTGQIGTINTKIDTINERIDNEENGLITQINNKANSSTVSSLSGQVTTIAENVNSLTTTVQEIQTSIDTTGGKNLADTFSEQIGDYPTIWALLKAKINEGEYSQIHVGDYVTLSLGNKKLDGLENFSFDFYVAGIDTYTGMADFENKNTIRHHIDFISKQLYITPRYFNKVAVNWNGKYQGTELANNWISSDLYAYMNGLKTRIIDNTSLSGHTTEIDYTATSNTASPFLTILDAFEDNDDENPIITPRRGFMNSKKIGASNASDSKRIVWCDDWGKFWLPSEYEITGRNVYSGLPEAYCYFQYPLFKNNHSFFQSNKDYDNNHKVTDHFYTSSAYVSGKTSFVSLNIHTLFPTLQEAYFDGSSDDSNTIKLSFPICFRIEAAPQPTGGET